MEYIKRYKLSGLHFKLTSMNFYKIGIEKKDTTFQVYNSN